ncbi:MAG TPA: hypothetical protein VGN90_03320 [Pyrinomonadaceae bacterium]|jgi:hypothetical protein|nr:hypothetical protein [Pyrinomonadaceae bacterium]
MLAERLAKNVPFMERDTTRRMHGVLPTKMGRMRRSKFPPPIRFCVFDLKI